MLAATKREDVESALAGADPSRAARVPIVRTLLSDLHTPLSIWLRLGQGVGHGFLLESVEGGERLARWSFIGSRPGRILRSWGHRIEIQHGGAAEVLDGDPRQWLRAELDRAPMVIPVFPELPRFVGGALGFFAWNAVRLEERLPTPPEDKLDTPDLVLGLYDEVVAFDHARGRIVLVTLIEVPAAATQSVRCRLWTEGQARLDRLVAHLAAPTPDPPPWGRNGAPRWRSSVDQEEFIDRVLLAQEHIRAGDVFQVVLSKRLTASLVVDPVVVYRALRALNPSPYLFLLRLGEHTLVGASPEMLLRVGDGVVETMPIAGTRPRGANPEEDQRLEDELRQDPKEGAEHEMLVDLGRNDLGRVCEYGTVRVTEHRGTQRLSHVMHLCSRVQGTLRRDRDALSALFGAFPAGTVSGAPKIRAIEILERLEELPRGVYGGAVGWLDWRGHLDTCIAIRTAVFHGGRVHIQAGAGVVLDSDPAAEWTETENKARALVQAVVAAESGGPP